MSTPSQSVQSSLIGRQPSIQATFTAGSKGTLPFECVGWIAVAVDFVAIMATSVITDFAYRRLFLYPTENDLRFIGIGLLIFANFSAILAARGNYEPRNLLNLRRQIPEIVSAWIVVSLILLGAVFSFKIAESFSRVSTTTALVGGCGVIVLWRIALRNWLVRALHAGRFAERRVIVIVEQGQLRSCNSLMELVRCGYRPVKTFEIRDLGSDTAGASRSLRRMLEEIIELSRKADVQELFILVKWERARLVEEVLSVLRILPLPIHLLPDENVARFLGTPMLQVGTVWTAELKRAPLTLSERSLKRAFDMIAAGLGLVLLAPLMFVAAVLIKLDSKGPILFTQARNGFNGGSFRILKFRSMSTLEDGAKIRQAIRNDPRVTSVGSWLRRTSLDELPQLFNVLGGSMSLVGPRPHAVAHNTEYERLVANYAFRYHMKPGISGWAQVNGLRGETPSVELMEKRVEADLWYVNNWSFWLDLRILWRTVLLWPRQPSAY